MQFCIRLGFNILKYIFFILPFIMMFKALYTCLYSEVWTFSYFCKEFINNLPFIGQMFKDYLWQEECLLSIDSIKNHTNIMELIFVGGIGGCLGRSIAEIFFSDYFKAPLAMDGYTTSKAARGVPHPNIVAADNASASSTGLASAETPSIESGTVISSDSDISPDQVTKTVTYAQNLMQSFKSLMKESIDRLKFYNSLPLTLDKQEQIQPFSSLVEDHSKHLISTTDLRTTWIKKMFVVGISIDNMVKISEIEFEIMDIKDQYLDKIHQLVLKYEENKGEIQVFLTEYYDETNIFRNKVSSCLNKVETLYTSSFREGPFSKNTEIKKIINSDYIEAKKSFKDQDQYLRKKIAEILHGKKKE